jgi:hypothetical protein
MIVGVLTLFYLFFVIAPWLDVSPISDLPLEVSPPEWARSFYINHGEYSFRRHGTISEQPYHFAAHVIAFFSILICLILSDWRFRRLKTRSTA